MLGWQESKQKYGISFIRRRFPTKSLQEMEPWVMLHTYAPRKCLDTTALPMIQNITSRWFSIGENRTGCVKPKKHLSKAKYSAEYKRVVQSFVALACNKN